ncbi:MAG: hypothetical protein RLZZ511_552 [Cyanobacteriota bacterium]|jgi:hypothetical protein
MSDTTSFLGGAALAGLAAMIVLRGGINFGAPTMSSPNGSLLPVPPSLPTMNGSTQNFSMPGTALPSPSPMPAIANGTDRTYEDAKIRLEVDQLKNQIEQQQQQIRSQQGLIDNLTLQAKANNLTPPSPMAPLPSQYANSQRNDDAGAIAGLPWALGGVLLTFGGGIALVGMMSMFAKQNNRSVRTVEYVQDDYPPAYMMARRRAQALPPRRTIRRVDLEDVE